MVGISHFEGIRIDLSLTSIVDASLAVADSLTKAFPGEGGIAIHRTVSRLALVAAMSATNAVFTMASAVCTMGSKPADIGVTTDSNGNLILRCGHSPPHEWSYTSGVLV